MNYFQFYPFFDFGKEESSSLFDTVYGSLLVYGSDLKNIVLTSFRVKSLEISTPPIPDQMKRLKTVDQIKNINSLNVNVSTQFILIANELYKTYLKKEERVRSRSSIQNYSGYVLRLKNTSSIPM